MPSSKSTSSVLLAGCGDLGERLGRLLVAEGRPALGLRRDPARLPHGMTPFAADLCEPDTLQSLPKDLEAVVYLASADAFTDRDYRRAYVDGLRCLLQTIGSPRRLLFVSSTSVLGQTDGSWVDEASETTDDADSQRRLLEGEALAREAGGTVVRLAGLYGPGRTKLLDRVRSGEATWAPGEDQWTNRIHADDAAAALMKLLRLEEPAPLYLGVDSEPAKRREVLEWLATRLDVAPPRGAQPPERRAGRPRSSKRCRNTLLRSTGWEPRYPSWREGYEAVLTGRA